MLYLQNTRLCSQFYYLPNDGDLVVVYLVLKPYQYTWYSRSCWFTLLLVGQSKKHSYKKLMATGKWTTRTNGQKQRDTSTSTTRVFRKFIISWQIHLIVEKALAVSLKEEGKELKFTSIDCEQSKRNFNFGKDRIILKLFSRNNTCLRSSFLEIIPIMSERRKWLV